MKKTKFLAGALALTLLAGCGAPAEPDDMAYQTADIKRDDAIVTVDGAGIAAEEYLFWLVNAISQAQYYGGLADDAAWAETIPDGGMTAAEAVKADALEAAKLYQVIRAKAAQEGVTLTEEQKTALDEELAQVVEQLGGEEELQAWLDARCITKEGFLKLNEVFYLNQNLQAKLEEDGALTVTEEDIDTFLAEQGIYAAKHILLSTRRTAADGKSYEEFTDEEKAQVLARAEEMCKQLRDAGNDEALFDELMNEHSEDGRDAEGNLYAPQGYTYVYPGRMVPEFEEGAKALEIGEVSDPIQTPYGYHIILRIPVDRTQAEAECNADYKLYALTQEWVDGAQVQTTKAYDALDAKAFYDRLQVILEAKEAAESEAPVESQAPAESEAPAESGTPAE